MHPTPDSTIQHIALAIFVLALVHTFAAKQFERLSHRFPRHAGLFHLLGEIEVVFGFWAIVLIMVMGLMRGGDQALAYAESRNYTEPLFVFVVMVVAASRPVLRTGDLGGGRHGPRRAPADAGDQRLAGSGGSALAGVADHRARGDDHCRADAGSADLQDECARAAQVPGPRRPVRQHLHRGHAHVICSSAGVDGGSNLAVDSAFMFAHFGWKAAVRWWSYATVATSSSASICMPRRPMAMRRKPGALDRGAGSSRLARQRGAACPPSGGLSRLVPDVPRLLPGV